MTKTILEQIIQLIFVLPLIFLTLKDRKPGTFKILSIFSIFFLIHSVLLHLPLIFKELDIFGGNWNWTGKVFAILGSIIFLLTYRKYDLKDYHLTLEQNKRFLKKGALILSAVFLVQVTLNLLYNSSKEWSVETILFQLSMPGIDEEIAFRGIMLGLLVKILKPYSKTIFSPAIFVTALLFGMCHGLFLNESYELTFTSSSFFSATAFGLIYGWITIKSGSIMLALISHNIGNVGVNLTSMIK